ncbi:MAG: class I SAM-dependent methyltransferase [Phycisphaerae bacterium]
MSENGTKRKFIEKILNDLGAAAGAPLVLLGDRLGLYKALAAGGPATSHELAERTGTTERYVREWLAAQAASGYVAYDAGHEKFSLTPDQEAVFADEDSPVFMAGAFWGMAALWIDEEKVEDAFRTGKGIAWGDYHPCLFCGTEKFFRPAYRSHLVSDWIPALDGVGDRLRCGARVADVGCGHGVSTLLMAEAFPQSTFVGFDIHEPSLDRARELASEAGVGNISFEVAAAKTYPGNEFDLVTFFDCLHDMGDPVGAAAHVHQSLARDGIWMIVEPFAHDRLEENLNPVGRICYAYSTMGCTPVSMSQEVGLALGAQAGEARLREVVMAGGFTRFRRAAETAFNIILEARP